MKRLTETTCALLAAVSCCGMSLAQPVSLPSAPAGVETFASNGIQFSRVQAASVQPFVPPNGANYQHPIGGGSWDFSISRTEITISTWIEFTNSLSALQVPSDQAWSFGLQTLLRGDQMTTLGLMEPEVH